MQPNSSTDSLQSSLSSLIDRTTLWDNSPKNDDNKHDKCVAPLNDSAWQSVSLLNDLIESKYGSNTNNTSNTSELIPWTNADLKQLDNWIEQTLGKYDSTPISSAGDLQQGKAYPNTFEHICLWEQQCQNLYNDVNEAVKYLDTLHDTYTKVSYKTNSLYRACEQLLADQTKLLNITELKVLAEELEQRCSRNPEYEKTLFDCHECYAHERRMLLAASVQSAIQDLAIKHERDMCTLVRGGCAFLLHLCQDEYQLFYQFFSKHSVYLDTMLAEFCNVLYDNLRSRIIHVIHLETLAELVTILKVEMIEEHVKNSAKELSTFETVCTQMLEDVQERLVYRTQVYIRNEILGYKPSPGDIAYPEKLEMMQKIAQSLKEQRASRLNSQSSADSSSDIVFETIPGTDLSVISSSMSTKDGQTSSPADLHGMWYPTVRRTLVCLSKLFRCLDRNIFQGLSQETLTMCVQSLIAASELITKRQTPMDGRLFLIKHLLILREQIAPFNVDFAVKEMVIDFTKLKEAAMKFLSKKSKLLSMNRDNAFLDFLLQGTLQVKESFIDSKREVDKHLKQTCELYIADLSSLLCGTIRQYLQRAQVILKLNHDQNNIQKVSLREQPFAKPEVMHDLIIENYNLMKKQLPDIFKTMSLYLANKDTEQILFKPIKNNMQQAYQELIILIRDQYSEEDLQIIGCPSQEQVRKIDFFLKARHRWASSTIKTLPTSTATIVETLEPFPYPNNINNSPSSSFFLPLTTMSNGRDRTSEFQTTVKNFASRKNGFDGPHPAPLNRRQHPQSPVEQRGVFMQQAKRIGHDLSQTFMKLEQLSLIAKQSSLFNDKSMEIQDLTLSIKQDISNLNRQIAQLQQYMQDTHGSKSKNTQAHSNSVVFVLQSKLATMSNDFKQVLEARTQNLKEQKSRRDNFSRNTVASSLTSAPSAINGRPSVLFRDESRTTNGGDAVIDMGSDGSRNSSMRQQLQVIDETDTYLANRSEAMQNIEQTIIELGDIFTQLATMVRQQEELVHRIDANVDEATQHIEGAHTELLKYLRSVTSNRWLIIKVFAVLIIFFLIFIVFLA
ncbi:unnamed protein product [Rotaria magnacalcarata]|uniref:t-SNARE coiled-coil homology domain-containing protein n=1 Tax=Rotaria magnacalcarata TaxID=392030 RepID=A0A8S2JV37_9BILA|nr:unnamed protein product [Rotaria magnacalcarata]